MKEPMYIGKFKFDFVDPDSEEWKVQMEKWRRLCDEMEDLNNTYLTNSEDKKVSLLGIMIRHISELSAAIDLLYVSAGIMQNLTGKETAQQKVSEALSELEKLESLQKVVRSEVENLCATDYQSLQETLRGEGFELYLRSIRELRLEESFEESSVMNKISNSFWNIHNSICDEHGPIIRGNPNSGSSDRSVRKKDFENKKMLEPHIDELYKLFVESNQNLVQMSLQSGYSDPIAFIEGREQVPSGFLKDLYLLTREYSFVAKKFYSYHQKTMGIDDYRVYDLGVALEGAKQKYTYDEALKIVLNLVENIHPKLYEIAQDIVNTEHISYEDFPEKTMGAWSNVCREGVYMTVRFKGDADSVDSFAHEFGHCIHNEIKRRNMAPISMWYVNLITTEFFSNLLQNLTLLSLFEKAGREEKMNLLEDLLSKVITNIAVTDFEANTAMSFSRGHIPDIQELNSLYSKLRADLHGNIIDEEHFVSYMWVTRYHVFSRYRFSSYNYAMHVLLGLTLIKRMRQSPKEFGAKLYQILLDTTKAPINVLLERYLGVTLSHESLKEGFELLNEMVDDVVTN